MNVKYLFAAVSISVSASGAMAFEATQFEDPPSTMTRAEVKAELQRAKTDSSVVVGGEATVFTDAPVAAARREREEVRAEARVAAHHLFNDLYVGA
jgi:riboflavin biosynthesis pyrimidine reductase